MTTSAARRTVPKPAPVPGVEVIRKGRIEPLARIRPVSTSAAIQWRGLAVEALQVPACVIPRHEHVHDFLNVMLSGSGPYEIVTEGKSLRFLAAPGATTLLPRGTVDESRLSGPMHCISVALHPSLLVDALDETAGESGIELTRHWNTTDRHILAVLVALAADLDEGSPTGRLYGESLANALAVYLLGRYAVQRRVPKTFKGGLPGYRLKRVLEFIGDHLTDGLALSELAAVAGMSPHYFSELFKQSTGYPPHRYVLLKRLERAKELLRDLKSTVLQACVGAGFRNPSHFARMFRRFEGISPSRFRSSQI